MNKRESWLINNPKRMEKSPYDSLQIELTNLGDEDYGFSCSVRGEFAGAADVTGKAELYNYVVSTLGSWLDRELIPKRLRSKRRIRYTRTRHLISRRRSGTSTKKGKTT